MLDKGLGNGAVHSIHGHVVGIVSTPSKGEFAEVASTNNKAVTLVGNVHQYLGALTCLTVLISHIVVVEVVANIEEVTDAGFLDADFLDGDVERLHQCHGIVVGAVGGAESWHRDADDLLARTLEQIHGLDTDEEGEGGVESTADADDYAACSRVDNALGKC